MPFGFVISVAMHAGLLFWAVWSMHAVNALTLDDTPAISAEVITASDFLRLKQGDEDSKKLETKAKDQPKQDDSKNETKKPDNAPPPPPPQQVATLEPAPPPEPPKVAPPKPVEPDPIAEKLKEPPPPEPAPAPGPTPEEQKALDQKIEEQRKAEEAKKKAEEEALKKKLAEEARKKKAAEEAKRKAARDQKAAALADLLSDKAENQQALADEVGDQVAGSLDDLIIKLISENWQKPPTTRKGMSVELLIQMLPDGTVTNASVTRSSGDAPFDSSAVAAVRNVGRIPEMQQLDRATFDKLYRQRRVIFKPEDLGL